MYKVWYLCDCLSQSSLTSRDFFSLVSGRWEPGIQHLPNRDLTKLRQRRQQQSQKAIGLVSKTTALHVHQAFWYISFPSLHHYYVKWPKFKFFLGRERQGDKFYHLCLNSGAAPSLQLQHKFPFFLSIWATWDNRETVWKDAESISQRSFHGRRRCRIGKVPYTWEASTRSEIKEWHI